MKTSVILLSLFSTYTIVDAQKTPSGRNQQGFRQECTRILNTARFDPIVSPNQFSSHSHTVAGSSLFSFNSTSAYIQTAKCTTCPITADKSNYWYPSLFYNRNGKFEYVPANIITYYEPRGNQYNKEFPQGFRMIAGNPFRRSVSTQEDLAVEWICIGRENKNNGSGQPIPQDCPGDIRGQIQFPVCGKADGTLYAADGSHMSYAYDKSGKIQFDGGDCPATHPVRYVKLFVEVWFGMDTNGSPRFVLSNGDPKGFGFHVDFLNGWKKGFLQSIVDTCNFPGGFGFGPDDCTLIKNGNFQSNQQKDKCTIQDTRLLQYQEGATSKGMLLDKLPGCNPITNGPDPAKPVANCPRPVPQKVTT